MRRHRSWTIALSGLSLVTMVACTSSLAGVGTFSTTESLALQSITSTSDPTTDSPAATPAPTTSANVSAPSNNQRPAQPSTYAAPTDDFVIPVAPSDIPDFNDADGGREIDVRALLEEITDAIQANDETAFLSNFYGAAHERAWFWWQNMTALGMDSGAAGVGWGWPTSVRLLNDRGSLFNVELGSHFPGDEVDASGLPVISTTTYYWEVEVTQEYPEPAVVEWVSVERAPWDCRCLLHVAKGVGGSVVASYPDERYLAENQKRNLNQAYEWSQVFWSKLNPDDPNFARPVMAFVSAKEDRLLEWFVDIDDNDPPNDVTFSAQTQLLERYQGPDREVSGQTAGAGARIVLNDEPPDDVAVIVHELAHYYLAEYVNDWGLLDSNASAVEGFAEMVLNVYRDTDLAAAEAGNWKTDLWQNNHKFDVRKLFKAKFNDKVPTPRQIYGDDAAFWYTMSSSVYAYIAETYGYDIAVATAICAHTFNNTALGCIPDSRADEPGSGRPQLDDSWIDQKSAQIGWVKWVRAAYG